MNLAEIILRKHEDAVFRIALQEVKSEGINTYSFGGLDYLSDKFATVLSDSGLKQGDVVAVVLPQSAAFAVAHLAILKMGAIVLPISFGADQLLIERLLKESGTKSLIIDESIHQRFINLKSESFHLETIFVTSDLVSRKDFGEGFRSFWYEVNFADSDFDIADIDAITPAYIFFEDDSDKNFKTGSFTHGEIFEIIKGSPGEVPEQKISWTTQDWALQQMISEFLFKEWFQGNAVASYQSQNFIDKNVNDFFQHLGYEAFPSS